MIAQIYESHFENKPNNANYVPKPGFKPSALGYKCLRKLFYSYLKVPVDFEFSPKLKKICVIGDLIHSHLSEVLRGKGILIDYLKEDGKPALNYFTKLPDYEFPIKDVDLEISAKIDALLKINNDLYIGEYKSINDAKFSELSEPLPEHKIQATLYYYLMQNALTDGTFKHIEALKDVTLKGVVYLYYNKNNSEVKEFIDEAPSYELLMSTLEKMMFIKTCVSNNTLPEKTKDWCQSCEYRTKCSIDFL